MYSEDELLPLSGLQHFLYCERQWALIHLEQEWEENRLTAEGRIMHERADEPGVESRGAVRIVRALNIRSLRIGIAGKADVVEFHRIDTSVSSNEADSVSLEGVAGRWRPFPVEYKRGRPKAHRADEVQVAAQALCLEEMLKVRIHAAALFYGQTRRRLDVILDDELRRLVQSLATRMHTLYFMQQTPPAVYENKKCEACSLIEICRPLAGIEKSRASAYLESMRREAACESTEADEP